MSKAIEEIQQPLLRAAWKREYLEQQLKEAKAEELRLIRDLGVLCIDCESMHPLFGYQFIQQEYFVISHGHPEGGSWINYEAELCHLQCPRCKSWNYLATHPQREVIVPLINRTEKERLFHAPILSSRTQ